MVHVGGLRQAGRARRVDVKRAIFDGERGTVGGGELVPGEAVEIAIHAREIGICVAMKPNLGIAGDVRLRAGERLEQFGGDDDVLWAHHIDAIGQRHPGEVGIDERNHAADPRDADPCGQKLRPARHHQTDRVALAKILRERPACIAVRARRKLPVREAFAVRQQRRGVAVFVRKLEDDLRKDPGWVPGDRGCQLERAHGADR